MGRRRFTDVWQCTDRVLPSAASAQSLHCLCRSHAEAPAVGHLVCSTPQLGADPVRPRLSLPPRTYAAHRPRHRHPPRHRLSVALCGIAVKPSLCQLLHRRSFGACSAQQPRCPPTKRTAQPKPPWSQGSRGHSTPISTALMHTLWDFIATGRKSRGALTCVASLTHSVEPSQLETPGVSRPVVAVASFPPGQPAVAPWPHDYIECWCRARRHLWQVAQLLFPLQVVCAGGWPDDR